MERKQQKTTSPHPGEIPEEQRELNASAHNEAEQDMEQDADLNAHHPNDDLDEGESARLGEGRNELI